MTNHEAKRRYQALLRRLAQEPRPISSIDRMSVGLDPLPELREGSPPLPAELHDALVAMWAAIFVQRARDKAAQRAAYQAWCDDARSTE
jgi:hypothetical protein